MANIHAIFKKKAAKSARRGSGSDAFAKALILVMSPAPFLSLKDILLAPPFPALVGIMLAFGVIRLGRCLLEVLLPDSGEVERLAGPVVAATLLGIIVETLALAGIARLDVVRVLAVLV